MLNKTPLWKALLVIFVVTIGALYASPNLYGEDPAVQVSGLRGVEVDASTLDQIKSQLEQNNIQATNIALEDGQVLVRFKDTENQLKARDILDDTYGRDYSVALNLVPDTPEWLAGIGGTPMKLGLDLSGGVSFLMEVNMKAAVTKAQEGLVGDFRAELRGEKIRYRSVKAEGDAIKVIFRNAEDLDKADSFLSRQNRDLLFTTNEDSLTLTAVMSDEKQKEIREYALQQNITKIRKSTRLNSSH